MLRAGLGRQDFKLLSPIKCRLKHRFKRTFTQLRRSTRQ